MLIRPCVLKNHSGINFWTLDQLTMTLVKFVKLINKNKPKIKVVMILAHDFLLYLLLADQKLENAKVMSCIKLVNNLYHNYSK